ncbi:MAG: NAD(P)-dependent oxidoreductase [Oscillospiraceae bacterium]|nr:NAD(P)-dependent oxidoreductase [Oscillospiraceae bacterium]
MSKHIIDDAKRCLQCKNPHCRQGCPIQSPIRDAIALLLDNKLEDAGRLLFANNPLSLVCSHICHQENQCEGHCVLGQKGMPVFISAIEKYISDFYLNIYRPVPSTGESGKVAIIGSGPAGITIAFFLAQKNYSVTIFEGHDQIGGVLRYGIPEFRLPKTVIDRLAETLRKSGVKIRPNTTIGANLSVDDLFRDGFHAIFMGTGVWRPNRLNIRGESLGHVHYAIDYLKNPEVYRLGKTLIVIGAGNVAVDVARTAVRHGCRDVQLFCHLDESGVTARQSEIEYAKIDGITLTLRQTPVEITDEGVVFADSDLYTDEEGRVHARPIPGTEHLEPADSVIVAISQGPRSVIVSSTTGIDVKASGLVAVDNCGHTTREGIFAGGDVVTGAKTVVEAVLVSRRVADSIDAYVREKTRGGIAEKNSTSLS